MYIILDLHCQRMVIIFLCSAVVYVDNLVLTVEMQEKIKKRLLDQKQALESSGLNVNMAKRKIMTAVKKTEHNAKVRFPYGVCGNGVGVDCTELYKLCCKR